MKVKTLREYDKAGKLHFREACCPYCGQLNWFIEEMRQLYHGYCEHLQTGYSTYKTFVFKKKTN